MNKRPNFLMIMACVGIGGSILLGWPAPASALNYEGITITPSFAYSGEFDDNVFRTPINKSSDYINHFIPGITVEAAPGDHSLKAGFQADIMRYSKNTTLDTERYFANFSGLFNFNRLQLRLKEDFAHTDDFPTSELTQRIKRNENYLTGGLDYDVISRWGIGFDFTWGNINYLDSDFDFLSNNAYTYATNVYYRITAKTRVFAEFDFVQEVFWKDNTRDDYRYRGLLGVRGDLTERFTLTAKGGYEYLDYYKSDFYSNQNNFVIALDASYRPLDRLQLNLLLSRSVQYSTFANNGDYGEFMTVLGAMYNFTPKIAVLPKGFFGVDNYTVAAANPSTGNMEKRLDYIFGGGIGVQYQIQKWLRFETTYEFQRRDSNFNDFSYSDNRVFFTVTLSL